MADVPKLTQVVQFLAALSRVLLSRDPAHSEFKSDISEESMAKQNPYPSLASSLSDVYKLNQNIMGQTSSGIKIFSKNTR